MAVTGKGPPLHTRAHLLVVTALVALNISPFAVANQETNNPTPQPAGMSLTPNGVGSSAQNRISVSPAGFYPQNFLDVGNGVIAFTSGKAASDNDALHILKPDGTGPKPRGIGSLLNPLAISDDFIILSNLVVIDRSTGKFWDPGVAVYPYSPPAEPPTVLIQGDSVVLHHWTKDLLPPGNDFTKTRLTSTLGRFHLPDLTLLKGTSLPFFGAFAPWADRYVGLGYMRSESTLQERPSIAILDKDFRIVAQHELPVERSADGKECPIRWAFPIIRQNLLTYRLDCGGIRVYDLESLQEVSRLDAVGGSYRQGGLLFSDNHLNIVDRELENGIALGPGHYHVREFDFPSLHLLDSFEFKAFEVGIASPFLYVVTNLGSPTHPEMKIDIYNSPSAAKAAIGLDQAAVQEQR